MSTKLTSHGDVQVTPSSTYGTGKTLLRVGNGGAGATGLLRVLADDFLSSHPDSSIDWVCNHSRNTQLALQRDAVDVVLTYERDMEALAEKEGWSKTVGCVFHDHFILVGPATDPADINSATTLSDAFRRIHTRKALFYSRQDGSATMVKENALWEASGLSLPVNDAFAQSWYKTSLSTPEEALINAAAAGAYLLTDRSTLLRQTWVESVHDNRITVFFEPTRDDDVLMNSCYSLRATVSNPRYAEGTRQFLAYLTSSQGQDIIANYGVHETGLPLFAPVADRFATTFLKGGRPKNGRWVFPSRL